MCRAKLADLFVSRKHYHAGIAGTMPSGVMGQDFAITYLKVCFPFASSSLCSLSSAVHVE